MNLNNKMNKNNSKEMPKKSIMANLRLINFVSIKNNNLQNNQNKYLK